MTTIDLNCDLGESFGPWEMGHDAEMIELATGVDVACGVRKALKENGIEVAPFKR